VQYSLDITEVILVRKRFVASTLLLLIIGFSTSELSAFSSRSDSLYLRVVVPEGDTTRSASPRHRIAGSTNPSAKAFVNGKEVKVYPSGAFISMLNLAVGVTPLHVMVRGAGGDSLVKDFLFIRPDPPKPLPHEPAMIDAQSVEPRQDLWLGKNDILEVKFRGSPGYKAYFDIEGVESGIPMLESEAIEQSGGPGVYIGRYKVKEADEAMGVQVRVRLKSSFWGSEKALSKGKVSILPQQLPRVAVMTGRKPFLNAGLGEDRLGGAKLGYIQSGVRVQVVGKVGRQYKIRLSDEMIGWLPEDFAQLLPPETPQPRSLTGTIGVSGNDTEDIVSVSLSQKLPYLTEQLVDPAAIVVDVFGATSNTNWITHQRSASGIKTVSWDQVGSDHYRMTIALNQSQHWGYDIGYDQGSGLRIRVKRPPKIKNQDSVLEGLIIGVDAGHGGEAFGAMGSTGVMEKNVNLAIASYIRSLLEAKGARVIMTRSDDSNVGMLDRADTLVRSGACILVSIHCNSIGDNSDAETIFGTSAYYRYLGFQSLANILYTRMLELGLGQFGLVGSFNFSLNSPTQFPNALVETAFLSNPEDEMKLLDDGFRKAIAEKVVGGLEQFVRTYAPPK
jgi:N-acetylmuramoyl-L-alanine amidase